jgi:hypothetical protein
MKWGKILDGNIELTNIGWKIMNILIFMILLKFTQYLLMKFGKILDAHYWMNILNSYLHNIGWKYRTNKYWMKNDVDIYDIAKNYPIASNSIIFIVILAILWTKITQSADIYVDIYKLSNSSPEE